MEEKLCPLPWKAGELLESDRGSYRPDIQRQMRQELVQYLYCKGTNACQEVTNDSQALYHWVCPNKCHVQCGKLLFIQPLN